MISCVSVQLDGVERDVMLRWMSADHNHVEMEQHVQTCSMTTGAPVSQDILEGTVRWRLMSVCLVLVRMEEHVLTLSMGTVVSAQVILRVTTVRLTSTCVAQTLA